MNRNIVITLYLLVGIAGIIGAFMAFHDPYGTSLNFTEEQFKRMPFPNLIIPGFFLLIVIGIGNLLGAFIYLKRKCGALYSAGMGLILMFWIIIQVYMLSMLIPPHLITFIIGFVQFIFGMKENLLKEKGLKTVRLNLPKST
jgi:hypothetical protein